jgi:hypothetical protein
MRQWRAPLRQNARSTTITTCLRASDDSHRPLSGTPNDKCDVPRWPNWWSTINCATTCKNVCWASFAVRTTPWCREQLSLHGRGATSHTVRIIAGRTPGVPSRFPDAYSSTSLMMGSCVSHTRLSTKLSTSRAAELFSADSLLACAGAEPARATGAQSSATPSDSKTYSEAILSRRVDTGHPGALNRVRI